MEDGNHSLEPAKEYIDIRERTGQNRGRIKDTWMSPDGSATATLQSGTPMLSIVPELSYWFEERIARRALDLRPFTASLEESLLALASTRAKARLPRVRYRLDRLSA